MHAGPLAAAIAGGFLVYGAATGQVAQTVAVLRGSGGIDQKLSALPRSIRIAGAGVVVSGLSLAGFDDVANGLALLIIGVLIMNLAHALPINAQPAQAVSGNASTASQGTATA